MGKRPTEQDSLYKNIEHMSSLEIVTNINQEDKKVADAVQLEISSICKLIDEVSSKLKNDGRLIYIGAGTSGRLGVLDASECTPTFGVSPDVVIGLIAGGDVALRTAIEKAEDKPKKGWQDLLDIEVNSNDFVVGISASGTTPYVLGALENCKKKNISTGCITCNPDSIIGRFSDFPIEVSVGPEFITGSTRMKSGTAQKMILNMISTGVMTQLGRVQDNKMVFYAIIQRQTHPKRNPNDPRNSSKNR